MDGPSLVVQFFHSLPHLDIHLSRIPPVFDSSNPKYLEALAVIGSVPILWLILTMIGLLTYFLTRCCDKKLQVPRPMEAHRWVLGFTAVLCCGSIAVGLYGNDDFHSGTKAFANALQTIQDNATGAELGAASVIESIQAQIEPQTQNLTKLLEKILPSQNASIHVAMVREMRVVVSNINSISDNLKLGSHILRSVHVQPYVDQIHEIEIIRWPVTIGVLSFYIFLCLVLIFGIVKGSRCTILLFTVLGLVCLVINWIMASAYLVAGVGGSDLCMNPSGVILNTTRDLATKELLHRYVVCNKSDEMLGPVEGPIREARLAVTEADTGVYKFVELSSQYYSHRDVRVVAERLKRHLGTASHNLSMLASLVDCRQPHQQYQKAVFHMCEVGMYGIAFMFLSSVATGLLFTILVWIGSHVWIYLKTRKGYLQVADQEPFLPLSTSNASRASGSTGRSQNLPSAPPGSNTNSLRYHSRHSHTPPQTPPFPGTLTGRTSTDDKDKTLTLRKNQEISLTSTIGRRSPPVVLGPNNGQYATLSKSCKTLESSDFY
ncbi:protein tweety-like [Artemia franciscana]|uniref:Protein tweety homolog n=1 Tax=Artemia franciscana TaxID=6661 RepID=A0AA88L0W2_ARTSF|nr:hypothetical protein QYM36_009109 [Artemia franciscana]